MEEGERPRKEVNVYETGLAFKPQGDVQFSLCPRQLLLRESEI